MQTNLGLAYSELPTGDRTDNLKKAMACYQEALRIWTPETEPLKYARAQTNLGNAYNELPTGDRAANQRMAIACFQEALRFFTQEAAPFEYAATQVNLGNAYSELPTGDHAANLNQAMACYQEALRIWTPGEAPFEYAAVQTFLGRVYNELPTGDRAANLRQAIALHREALSVWTPETAPLDYAMAQANLGTALSELPAGDRAANLGQAIHCYQEALRVWMPENAPFNYLLVYINLGNIYSELPTGDRAANLRQAIACYQEALRLLTPEAAPLRYAMAQANLGTALSNLEAGDRAANLNQVIACYQEALRIWTPETAPLEYARLQNNLGIAYDQLPAGDRAANLRRAIDCYQEALRFRTPDAAPFNYAVTQMNLGIALADLPAGDRAVNLNRAIACYREALHFFAPETVPFDYAGVQINLGNAYRDLPAEDRASNLNRAIACYREALRFFTPEAAPVECRRASHNLAHLYFEQKNWEASLDAYHVALEAGELLYRAGLSPASKAAEIDASALLYRRAAFSAARLGKTAEALLILERGKTRLLAEALRLSVPRPKNVPEAVWRHFEQAGLAFRNAQVEKPTAHNEDQDLVESYTARQQAAQSVSAALDEAIGQIRAYAPDFLRSTDLAAIQGLLSDAHTAILTFCITDQGSIGIVVSGGNPTVRAVELPTLTRIKLRRLFVEVDSQDRAIGGWLGDYYSYRINPTQTTFARWQETITRTLSELRQSALGPLLAALPAGADRILIVPSAELFLFPLHAVPLSSDGAERLCDRYQVSYSPSLEVLASVRAKAVQGVTPDLYAVINPQADPRLVFTPLEGSAIAKLFAQHEVDKEETGTKQQVIAGVQGHSYVHFSCHGAYNWSDAAQSGLELADGRLTLAELQRGVMDLSSARLVTLSACETGVSDVIEANAEEYVGIPAGFLLAGVPCVVSSLWAVPDLSTALLMERFYRNHLGKRMDFAAALREAQRWVRELSVVEVARYVERGYRESEQRGKEGLFRQMRYYQARVKQNPALRPFEHPYFWAAFTINGW
jgi:CHAT domain-containing protein/tetratricopeptide (TPR) repeat protein